MAWPGYFEFGGTEIINATRVETYAALDRLPWFKAQHKNEALPILLSETYTSPLVDDAPWTDWRDPDSYDFYGVYPLDIGGIEDSTWEASVVQNTSDGGVVSRVRKGTRSVTFSVALIGATECAVESGMRWLRTALGGAPCRGTTADCGGQDLCYLRCEPTLNWDTPGEMTPAEVQDCLDGYTRTLRDVTFTVGPVISRKNWMSDGGAVWLVNFTATAANPYEWGQEVPLVAGFMSEAVPYVGGVLPSGATFDDEGEPSEDTDCALTAYDPVYDPECPLIIPPATVPMIDLTCVDFPETFQRRMFTIPSAYVPIWGEVVPLLTIRTAEEVRNLRVRFYADPFNDGSMETLDPCGYCGNMVFTYIPAESRLIFDASDQVIYLEQPNGDRRRAEALVFGEEGVPFEWPELSCGISYVVTVDLPVGSETPSLDLSMFARVA